jgi:hypothetical protein
MNYQAIYNSLIQRGKNRTLEGYSEKHHIIPRCMGGNDDSENLVKLTAREHFIAHRLLTKIYPDNHKLKSALFLMSRRKISKVYFKISSRTYEHLKKQFDLSKSSYQKGRKRPPEANEKAKQTKIKNGTYGKKHSEETKAKIKANRTPSTPSEEARKRVSELFKGRKIDPKITQKGIETKIKNGTYKKPISEETRAKLSAAKKGKKISAEERAKRYPNGHGKKHSAETRAKISAVQKGKKRKPESIAKMIATITGRKLSEETKAKISAAKKGKYAGISKPFAFERTCKICNIQFTSKSSRSEICYECVKPKECKCGCGKTIKTPGKYFCFKYNKSTKNK